MPTALTPAELVERYDLPDWRVVLQAVEAWFDAPSYAAGAAFVAEVAALADEVDHHPDLDLRYRRVHVRLTTHDVGGLSDLDGEVAGQISALAAAHGLTSRPLGVTALEVAIDALDIDAVRPFWAAVLGYVDEPEEEGTVRALRDPAGISPGFWFQQMDEPRPQRNRIHLDVVVPHDEVQARIDATLAAGGTLVSDAAAPSFWVLADPEGNEACLCTWQGRG